MSLDSSNLDAQIERLREGGTLSEHEVKALCDQVSATRPFSPQHGMWANTFCEVFFALPRITMLCLL
jgi:hypothetical protein